MQKKLDILQVRGSHT